MDHAATERAPGPSPAARDVQRALALSSLARLPATVVAALLDGAEPLEVEPGEVTHRFGDTTPHLELVVSGVVRVFVTAPDGRTMTVRYCRPGALIGAVSLFSPRFVMPGTTQALVPSVVLRLSPRTVLHEAQSDLRVAHALLEELADRVVAFIGEIPGTAFTSVRQRVARHLLDLSSPVDQSAGPDDELVAAVTQRELAEAVGTSREVVVRTLRELREQGIVRTSRDRIVVTDPARLVDDLMWNTGS